MQSALPKSYSAYTNSLFFVFYCVFYTRKSKYVLSQNYIICPKEFDLCKVDCN